MFSNGCFISTCTYGLTLILTHTVNQKTSPANLNLLKGDLNVFISHLAHLKGEKLTLCTLVSLFYLSKLANNHDKVIFSPHGSKLWQLPVFCKHFWDIAIQLPWCFSVTWKYVPVPLLFVCFFSLFHHIYSETAGGISQGVGVNNRECRIKATHHSCWGHT